MIEEWRYNLKTGDVVDCLDNDQKWCEAKIKEIHGHLCKIHYIGWSIKYDTTENLFSVRLQPYNTKTKKWREFIDVGDIIEILEIKTSRIWYFSTIVDIDRVNGMLTVFYGNGATERTKTVDILGEEIASLGTHVRISQTVVLTNELIQLISQQQFKKWQQQTLLLSEETQNTTKYISENNSCCVCFNGMKNTVLLPCKHLCVCSECSTHPLLIYCPLCKIRINDRMNVFV